MFKNDPQWVDVKAEGENTGQEYFGRFCLKPFLTHEERTDAIRLAEMYCRGIRDDVQQRAFMTTQAFLKFHVVETDARWWDDETGATKILDESPVYEIAQKVKDVQDSLKPKKAQETPAPTESEEKAPKKSKKS